MPWPWSPEPLSFWPPESPSPNRSQSSQTAATARLSSSTAPRLLSISVQDMERAAKAMEFMEAARLRDELHALEARRKEVGK